MNEIKQLFQNGFFKKILILLGIVISSLTVVSLGYHQFLNDNPWLKLFLIVLSIHLLVFLVFSLVRWVPWKTLFQKAKMAIQKCFHKKDPLVKQIQEEMRSLHKLLRKNTIPYSHFPVFHRLNRLPLYICFESQVGLFETYLDQQNINLLFEWRTHPAFSILVSQEAVFILIEKTAILEKVTYWQVFSQSLKRYKSDYSSISSLILLGDESSKQVQKQLAWVHFQLQTLSRQMKQKIAVYGLYITLKAFIGLEAYFEKQASRENGHLAAHCFSEKGLTRGEWTDFTKAILSDLKEFKIEWIHQFTDLNKKWLALQESQVAYKHLLENFQHWNLFLTQTENRSFAPFFSGLCMGLKTEYSHNSAFNLILNNTKRAQCYHASDVNREKPISMALLSLPVLYFCTCVYVGQAFSEYKPLLLPDEEENLVLKQVDYVLANAANFKIMRFSQASLSGLFSIQNPGRYHETKTHFFQTWDKIKADWLQRLEEKLYKKELANLNYAYEQYYSVLKALLVLDKQSPLEIAEQVQAVEQGLLAIGLISSDTPPAFLRSFLSLILNEKTDLFKGEMHQRIQNLIVYLQTALKPQWAYQKLIDFLNVAEQDKMYSMNESDLVLSNPKSSLIKLGYTLPSLYTKAGFEYQVKGLIDRLEWVENQDDWVFGKIETSSRLKQKDLRHRIESAYVDEFTKHWVQYLSQVTLLPMQSTQDALVKLDLLLNEKGGFMDFIRTLAHNLSLISEKEDHIFSKNFVEILSVLKSENSSCDYVEGLKKIKAELNALSMGAEHNKALVKTYLSQLFESQDKLGNGLSDLALSLMNIKSSAKTALEKRFLDVLISPLIAIYDVLSKEAITELEKEWKYNVVAPFNQTLSQRFPFSDSIDEVTLSDFNAFFNPLNGKFSVFFKENLAPFLEKQAGKVKVRSWMHRSLPIQEKFLDHFSDCLAWSEAFFDKETGKMGMQFKIYPKPSPVFSAFSIQVNGQDYHYRNEPEEWRNLQWNPTVSYPKSTIEVTWAEDASRYFKTLSGDWAFFRLITTLGSISKIDLGHYRLSVMTEKAGLEKPSEPIIFYIKMASHSGILEQIQSESFRIQETIVRYD